MGVCLRREAFVERIYQQGVRRSQLRPVRQVRKRSVRLPFHRKHALGRQHHHQPTYKYAIDFVYKALQIVPEGKKVCMFLKIQFLEGKARRKLFRSHPPKVVYVSSSRLLCAPNGDFEHATKNGGSAVAYAWFVWEKGFKGDTIVKWIN